MGTTKKPLIGASYVKRLLILNRQGQASNETEEYINTDGYIETPFEYRS
jgi:hypothetical protein